MKPNGVVPRKATAFVPTKAVVFLFVVKPGGDRNKLQRMNVSNVWNVYNYK